ncbi:sigma factor-like helix-turn-helix DNA-binding protein [Streptomyces sp. NPDC096030]|uniref:sigma factor-like helix-turn-helix DNA-binding protein n=1 Tax=Streptomyces sp. NPDC096030 TaxID=3155423 RepID=UPI003330F401
MDDGDAFLARRFDIHEERLRGVALRMLGSRREAAEAVGEARSAGLGGIDGWLTTVVARVCVERLRARRDGCEPEGSGPEASGPDADVREREGVQFADGVQLALFAVLECLTPDERLAFVLHDLFALPLPDVARLTGRTTSEAAQLVRAARGRVRGAGSGGGGGGGGGGAPGRAAV